MWSSENYVTPCKFSHSKSDVILESNGNEVTVCRNFPSFQMRKHIDTLEFNKWYFLIQHATSQN